MILFKILLCFNYYSVIFNTICHYLGLDEQHRDNSGWTPLHYAAFEGHQVVCRTLLESGAKIDQTDNDGKPPLMLAAEEGHSDLVGEFLKNYGAPPDQKAHDGRTAIRYCFVVLFIVIKIID